MALFPSTANSWMQRTGFPPQVFGTEAMGGDDYELYEEDGEFVLTIDMPGFEREGIDLAWDDGVLNVAAEHVDESRGRKKTYHRRFRFPKDVDGDDITARYENGVLEVTLPTLEGTAARGKAIPIEG